MFHKARISARQYTLLICLFTIGSSILLIPSGLAGTAHQDAWIAALLVVIVGTGLAKSYGWFGQQMGERSFVQYCEHVLGRWGGGALALLYIMYFFLLASLVLRNIGDFLTTQIMPDTPIQIVNVLFMIVVIMAARLGLETLARTSEILFPWVILLFVLMVLFVSKDIKLENIQPIYEGGIKQILLAAFPFVGTPFLEIVIFIVLFPAVKNVAQAQRGYWIGTLIGGVILLIVVVITILVMGPELTANNVYPSYSLAKKISVAQIIERVEALMAGIWFASTFMKVSVCFIVSVQGLAQVCKLKDERPLTIPMGVISIVLSLVAFPNLSYQYEFISRSWTPFAATFGIFLPALLLITAKIRKR